jgi:uncharacterized protein (DUF362 family)
MNRRDFLKWQLGGALFAVSGTGLILPRIALAAAAPDAGMVQGMPAAAAPDVAIVKGTPGAAARAAVDLLGGMGRFVRAGQKVVIKPNMSFARGPENAVNTHPEVVRELVVMCKEAGAGSIRVLDNSLQDPEDALKLSGIRDACDSVERGICHHLMEASFYRDDDIIDAKEMRGNAFMRDILDADVIIAAPVAKSHSSTGVSLSLKGQMGLILNRSIMHSRYSLDTAIVDLNTRIKPRLAVIDASRVLTTGGPGGPGKIVTPGEIIASADPVAADATAVASYEWYGRRFQPRQVAHISEAHARGLGRMDIENLDVRRLSL